jgi:hypothetical protein
MLKMLDLRFNLTFAIFHCPGYQLNEGFLVADVGGESAMLSGPGPSLRIGAIIGVVVFFIIHFTNAGKCLFSHYSFLPIIFHLLDVPITKSIQALDFENKVLIEKTSVLKFQFLSEFQL